MIQQQANALTFYGFFTASKAGATGLTVTADVYEATTAAPIVSAASATELAGGLYYYTLASGSVDADGAYIAIFKTADATVDQQHIPAVWHIGATWVDRIDATVSSRSTVTTAAIADAVWDEVITGAEHNINTSAAKFLRESAETVGVTGTAQSGTSTTVTLAAAASAIDDIYNGERIGIIEGTGAGQYRLITDYVGATKVATVSRAWNVTPDNTSVYVLSGADVDAVMISGAVTAADNVEANIGNLDSAVSGASAPSAASVADAVWDETIADHAGAGSTGAALSSATAPSAATVADAVWDEATSGHNSAGTFGAKLLDLVDQSSVTVVTAVSGSTITVYTDSYWSFTVSGLGDTSGYETLLLTVKASTGTADSAAHLYLRSDTGLIAIGTGAPSSAGNGALTNDGTGFTATVEMAETAGLSEARNLTWWLKGLDTTPDPDTGTVIATGEFNILASGAKATS